MHRDAFLGDGLALLDIVWNELKLLGFLTVMNEEMKKNHIPKRTWLKMQSTHIVCQQINQFVDVCDWYIYSIVLDLRKNSRKWYDVWSGRMDQLCVFKSVTKPVPIIPFESMILIGRVPTAQY